MKIYALEVTAHTGADVITLYYSTSPAFVSRDKDTPPSTTFIPRIVQPGNFSIQAFQDGKTWGKSQVGYGEIVLDNWDGSLDNLMGYGFDGRRAVLRMLDDRDTTGSTPYPSGWKTVFTGTVEQPEATWAGYNEGTIVLKLRDGMAGLRIKLPLGVYAGNNLLPLGLEGTADDLKGKTKPLLLGKCFNMPLQCVNTSKLIYAVSPPAGGLVDLQDWDAITNFNAITNFFGTLLSGPIITQLGTEYRRGGCSSADIELYDAGVSLAKGADYADEVDMLNNPPAAGGYRVLPASGYIRTGSSPSGELTCTAQDNNGHDANTVGSIIRSVLRDYLQWEPAQYNIDELAALDTACPIPMGYLINQDTYVDDLLDTLCNAAGACYYFDAYGVFRIIQVVDPMEQSSVMNIDEYIGAVTIRSSMGIPSKQIRLRQQRNWSPQTSGLAGSVAADRRAWLSNEYRENISHSVATAAKHLLSQEMAWDTCFSADAQAECDRRLSLYSVRRDLFDIEMDTELFYTPGMTAFDEIMDFDAVTSFNPTDFSTLQIGQVVSLGLNGRYGYSGKNMMVTGITMDLVQQKLMLTVWG